MDRAKTVWIRMPHILSREGSTPRVSGFFLKAVIRAILLSGTDTWLVTPRMGKALGGGSEPSGKTVDGKSPTEKNRQDVEIHLVDSGKGDDGFPDNGGIRQAAPEQGCTVYLYTITVRPVSGVGEGSWGASRDAVVGTGGNLPVRVVGGNSVGGGRGGGRGVTGSKIERLLDWSNVRENTT